MQHEHVFTQIPLFDVYTHDDIKTINAKIILTKLQNNLCSIDVYTNEPRHYHLSKSKLTYEKTIQYLPEIDFYLEYVSHTREDGWYLHLGDVDKLKQHDDSIDFILDEMEHYEKMWCSAKKEYEELRASTSHLYPL